LKKSIGSGKINYAVAKQIFGDFKIDSALIKDGEIPISYFFSLIKRIRLTNLQFVLVIMKGVGNVNSIFSNPINSFLSIQYFINMDFS
jgi:hypothetical protein